MMYRIKTDRLRTRWWSFCGLLLVWASFWSPGRAQTTQGSIIGTVRDPGGAVVTRATVTLTNTDEGTSRQTLTNTVGDYRFVDVKAGHYSIQVSASGFDKWSVSGAALAVRQELRVDAIHTPSSGRSVWIMTFVRAMQGA